MTLQNDNGETVAQIHLREAELPLFHELGRLFDSMDMWEAAALTAEYGPLRKQRWQTRDT